MICDFDFKSFFDWFWIWFDFLGKKITLQYISFVTVNLRQCRTLVRPSGCYSNATAQEEPSTTTSSEDEDYGYDTSIEQQIVVGESILHARANRARVEALNYLDDREKGLQILSGYPNVCATFLKYNTSLPSSAPVERLFSTGGTSCLMMFLSNC